MRLEYVHLHNVGPFENLEVDLTDLPAEQRIIAVVGANGRGKSFLLEAAIPGVAYRRMPTQGTLIGRATSRDAFVEARIVNGRPWNVVHRLDSIGRKGESIVRDAEGKLAYEGSSVKAFEAWARRHLPPDDLLFSSLFAAQRKGKNRPSFIELDSSERISVILQAVGVSRLEQMAELARKRAARAASELEVAEARLADERSRGGDVAAAEEYVREAREHSDMAELTLERCREDLAEAQRQAAEADRLHIEWRRTEDENAKRRSELNKSIAAAQARCFDLNSRIENNRKVLADADVIRAAVEELSTMQGGLELASARLRDHEAARDAAQAESRAAAQIVIGAEKRIAAARAVLRDAERVQDAMQELEQLRATVEEKRQRVERAREDTERVQSLRISGANERIGELREGLAQVSGAGDEADVDDLRNVAERALQADDDAAELASTAPELQRKAHADLGSALVDLRHVESRLVDTERLAARHPSLEAARAVIEMDEREVAEAKERCGAAESAWIVARDCAVVAAKDVGALRSRIAELQPLAKKAEPLAGAEARLAELEPQIAQVTAELAELSQQVESTPAPKAPPPSAPSVAVFETALREAEAAARRADQAVAVAEQRLEQTRAVAGKLAELEAERVRVEAELADWNRLAADLGRDGLQSAEVDSAGPELTELVNDLLHSCHGPRFTVSIETTRLSADGKKQIDECGVRVIDTVAGRDAEAREFSGGERVIIGEAVSLALSMLACRRSGVERPTLVRDETGAALDPENAQAYVAMLRRAADIVGASHVLFVSHTPETWDLADVRLQIGDDGKAVWS